MFYLATDAPGPGIYRPQNDLSNEGKYVLSKNLSNGQRKFLDGRRLSFTEIMARRSFSNSFVIKPLDLEAIDLLLSSVNMIKGNS
jgi:hypothetical protein